MVWTTHFFRIAKLVGITSVAFVMLHLVWISINGESIIVYEPSLTILSFEILLSFFTLTLLIIDLKKTWWTTYE